MTVNEPTRAPQLGAAIQRARKMRQLTLDQLAQRSGVSKSMLSQIERGRANPTFVTLWNLTDALGVDIGSLVDEASPRGTRATVIDHVKAYSTPIIRSTDSRCELRILSPTHTILPVEWYEIRIEPGGVLRSERHIEGTYEHLTCLDGELVLRAGDRTVTVGTGDTVRYVADQTREFENSGTSAVRAILVVALPSQYRGGS